MNLPRGILAPTLLLGLVAATSVVCAEPAEQEQTPVPSEAPEGLEGPLWRLAAYRSGDTLAEIVESERPALFRFEDGRVSGSAGCNRLLGGYTLDGEGVTIDPRMAATMRACPEPVMAQEQAVGAALKQVAGAHIDGNLLELADAEGQPLLRLVWEQPTALKGPIWQLERYNNGKQAAVTVLADTEVTLELRDDGTIGGSDGCNRYMSGYTLEDASLRIGPLATTRMACKGPDGADAQAAAYAAALARVEGYRIEGDALTLTDDDGETLALYRSQSDLPPNISSASATAPVTREGSDAEPTAETLR